MKTVSFYDCEKCGKRFSTAEEAAKCERSHVLEEKKKELAAKSEEAINKLVNQHIKEFKEVPTIDIESDNLKLLGEDFALIYKLLGLGR